MSVRPSRSRVSVLVLGIWGLGAPACSGTRQRPPEPALIELQADSESAEPARAAAPEEDVALRLSFQAAAPIALRRFLEELMKALLRHDLRGFLALCDQENLSGQRRLGIDDEQYIAEALVPDWSRARIDRQPAEDDAPRFQFSDLRRIRGVLIDQVRNQDARRERYQVSGMLELSGSVFFVFQLEVRRDGERYRVDPPMG